MAKAVSIIQMGAFILDNGLQIKCQAMAHYITHPVKLLIK